MNETKNTMTNHQNVLTGTGVGRGTAVAPIALVSASPVVPENEKPGDPATDIARVDQAVIEVAANLRSQAQNAEPTLASVLQAAAAMAEDPALAEQIKTAINAGMGPATAVEQAINHFAATFQAAGGYLAERVTDLMSIRHRVIAKLLNLPEPGVPQLQGPTIIVASDLSPADTADLNFDHVAGIVTELGGPTSHTAIIAGQLDIPCLVGVRGILDIPTDATIGINALAGTVVVNPTDEEQAGLADQARQLERLAQDTSAPATKDGHPIELLANIGTVSDAARATAAALGGVGLFRTEILFLSRQNAPSKNEQVEVYGEVFAQFPNQKVVTRTLDAGADKPLTFATLPGEENPALGVRGYRTARIHPQLLTDQLEALAAAAQNSDTDSWVMAPMIATAAEAKEFATAARSAGIKTVGVMIEIPAAALQAEQILAEVDFLSIGTNDLAQYTMAADRLSADLIDLTNKWQPAILELIGRTAAAGQKLNRPVGVCGESAGDPLMALVLTGLGITSLSMAPAAAVAVRYLLHHHTLEECQEMAQAALAASDADQGRDAVRELIRSEARATLGL